MMMERKCTRCGVAKATSEFYTLKSGRLCSHCKCCAKHISRQYKRAHPEKAYEQHRRFRERYPSYSAEHSRRWRLANPEKRRANDRLARLKSIARDPLWDRRRNLWKSYRIRLEKYEELYKLQLGRCAICGGVNLSGRRLAVDHDHNTGAYRGLLCANCNTGLGHFKDSIEVLAAAQKYLDSHKASQEATNED